MGCSSCAKKKQNSYQDFKSLDSPPYRASDIIVYDTQTKEHRTFNNETDWSKKPKILLFVPSVDTIKEISPTEPSDGLDIIYVTSQPIHQILDYYQNNESNLSQPTLFSSYLLPSRLNLIQNGNTRKAIVYTTEDGEVITQQLFYDSSFNYETIIATLDEHDSN